MEEQNAAGAKKNIVYGKACLTVALYIHNSSVYEQDEPDYLFKTKRNILVDKIIRKKLYLCFTRKIAFSPSP